MGYAKLIPVFSCVSEIRMGSPYRLAEMELQGNWIPELPKTGWQDLFAESVNGRYLGLVAWMTENNEPGFKLVVIDKREQVVRESQRIPGCCQSLSWQAGFSFEVAAQFREEQILTWNLLSSD